MTSLRLVPNLAVQEAELHRELRETQAEVARRVVGLLDWLIESTPDTMTSVLIDLDEAICRIERARGALGG